MFSILVVEDNESLNKMMSAKLKMETYNVFSAFNGEEALDILEHEHIDLIISDVMMPGIDGYELTRTLRNANYTIPILMITAKNQIEDMEKGFVAGTDDYMIKPINMREMILRVNALLRRAKIANERRLILGNTILDYDSLTIIYDGKEYKKATVTTFLMRLMDKGFISMVRDGKSSKVHAIRSEESYKEFLLRRDTDFWYKGKIS